MKITVLVLCIFLVGATGLSSLAHEHASDVVKERMDAMSDMAKHNKAIIEKIKAKRDMSSIKADAEAIATHAPHIMHLFPKGSMQKPTQARAAIWQNWADFEAKAKALEDAALRLTRTDVNDAEELGRTRTAMSQTCGACHGKYRTRR